uniref:MICAL-like 1a n=1 Tax=Neogobius melanostomus TaxID=47308 RepID=A0A8C6WG10_9GOBI
MSRALQEWCRIQCEDHHDVDIKDMSSSFRDGLAFCALIHRYRPDLIDFSSLSKENVYENNRLAFEVAETQLGIPALLDPEDMVSMKVPDRLSVITYVSQYYNFFNNKSQGEQNTPKPSVFEEAESCRSGAEAKRSTLSSTCSICNKHVHLVQRFLVDGKLFHRNCFRCTECHSTLLPGSYKLQSSSGSLVCTHHIARHALSSQNGRPDLSKKPELSKKPVIVESARIGRSPVPYASSVPSKTEETENLSSNDITSKDAIIATPVVANEADSIEKAILSPSQPSSCSASPALSTESLSSSSEQRSAGGASSDQEQTITKSTSEPSISTPGDSTAASSNDQRVSLNPCPPHVPSYASSAPATPQTSRSTNGSTAPSPLAANHKVILLGRTIKTEVVKRICKENPFNRKASPAAAKSKSKPPKGPHPARPPAPGHGFPLIKRKVQSDQYIPVEDIHGEMSQLEKQLDELEHRGVELERKLRDNPNDEDEERLLVDWFTLIHEKHLLVRREAELVYTAKQQNLEERQADVEYELRCLLNKPEKDWTEEDKSREQELMAELVTIIEQRNQIINNMDQDRQREEEEDKLMEAMLKKKDFSKEPNTEHHKKKGTKFKSMKVFKRLSHKVDHGKSPSPRKEQS